MIYPFPCSVGTFLLLNHPELGPVKEFPLGSNLKTQTVFMKSNIEISTPDY